MSEKPLLTNVVVTHRKELLSQIELVCPHNTCQVKAVDLSSADLQPPWNSNQIAEARQYFVVDPKELTTPFVSFSSYRLPEKTLGQIGHHDMCRLVQNASKRDVYSPYVIKNSLARMLNPAADAEPYTFDVKPILNDLLSFCSKEFQELSRDIQEPRFLPMCNSFCCSTKTYSDLHAFIVEVIQQSWQRNQFNFQWKDQWIASYPGREAGLLFERATAYWFASQTNLEIRCTGWAQKFPRKILNFHPSFLGWRKLGSDELDTTN
jgi:hypothetical protein